MNDLTKEYIKVDGNDEDLVIQSLTIAAETYLENAGCPKDYGNDLYKLAVNLLVSTWHNNRDPNITDNKIGKLQFSLDTIITQLRYCAPESGDSV